MSRMIFPLILGVTLCGAHLSEAAWTKANRHQLTHSCGAC